MRRSRTQGAQLRRTAEDQPSSPIRSTAKLRRSAPGALHGQGRSSLRISNLHRNSERLQERDQFSLLLEWKLPKAIAAGCRLP
jgi:hypothetical protein